MINLNNTFITSYRTGGTENFAWHICERTATEEAAKALSDKLNLAGYKTVTYNEFSGHRWVGEPA